jgi:hypothetical protein
VPDAFPVTADENDHLRRAAGDALRETWWLSKTYKWSKQPNTTIDVALAFVVQPKGILGSIGATTRRARDIIIFCMCN